MRLPGGVVPARRFLELATVANLCSVGGFGSETPPCPKQEKGEVVNHEPAHDSPCRPTFRHGARPELSGAVAEIPGNDRDFRSFR